MSDTFSEEGFKLLKHHKRHSKERTSKQEAVEEPREGGTMVQDDYRGDPLQ